MSVVESSSLKTFVERNTYTKAAFICGVNYMQMWDMVEQNAPIRIIQNHGIFYVWRKGLLLNKIKASTLHRRGIL